MLKDVEGARFGMRGNRLPTSVSTWHHRPVLHTHHDEKPSHKLRAGLTIGEGPNAIGSSR